MKILDVTPPDRSAPDGHAPAHYLSPDRRDPVRLQRGLGAAHSLIAVAIVAPQGNRPTAGAG